MPHLSGNATWQDYPNTATMVSATRLENIEGAIDGLSGVNGAVTVQASVAGGTSTTSTTYVGFSTVVGATFQAPATGKVWVEVSASIAAGTSGNLAAVSFELRSGGTVGSGTVVTAASDSNSISTAATTGVEAGRSTIVTGLTAGSTYNVQAVQKTAAGTGFFARGRVIVTPLTA